MKGCLDMFYSRCFILNLCHILYLFIYLLTYYTPPTVPEPWLQPIDQTPTICTLIFIILIGEQERSTFPQTNVTNVQLVVKPKPTNNLVLDRNPKVTETQLHVKLKEEVKF